MHVDLRAGTSCLGKIQNAERPKLLLTIRAIVHIHDSFYTFERSLTSAGHVVRDDANIFCITLLCQRFY